MSVSKPDGAIQKLAVHRRNMKIKEKYLVMSDKLLNPPEDCTYYVARASLFPTRSGSVRAAKNEYS